MCVLFFVDSSIYRAGRLADGALHGVDVFRVCLWHPLGKQGLYGEDEGRILHRRSDRVVPLVGRVEICVAASDVRALQFLVFFWSEDYLVMFRGRALTFVLAWRYPWETGLILFEKMRRESVQRFNESVDCLSQNC